MVTFRFRVGLGAGRKNFNNFVNVIETVASIDNSKLLFSRSISFSVILLFDDKYSATMSCPSFLIGSVTWSIGVVMTAVVVSFVVWKKRLMPPVALVLGYRRVNSARNVSS